MPVSLYPRSIRVCLLFAFQRSEGFAASFRVACSLAAARPGWFRAGGAVRGAGGRRAEAPAGGRDSLDPLGRPSRVFPQLRADGFEAAGTQSDRHHVYGVSRSPRLWGLGYAVCVPVGGAPRIAGLDRGLYSACSRATCTPVASAASFKVHVRVNFPLPALK